MRQLLPEPLSIDDASAAMALLAADDRPAGEGRPWVIANMVASIDGTIAIDGRSGGLGTAGDKVAFHCLRGIADVILVGAGTARAENYQRPRPAAVAQGHRLERHQGPAARLVLVSRSGHIAVEQRYLAGEGPTPLMVHADDLDPKTTPDGVETMQIAGADGSVDLKELLGRLRASGASVVLCEGGPALLGQLHREDLIDELFVTTSPMMVGGTNVGILGHIDAVTRRRRLHRLWLDEEDALLATWRRP